VLEGPADKGARIGRRRTDGRAGRAVITMTVTQAFINGRKRHERGLPRPSVGAYPPPRQLWVTGHGCRQDSPGPGCRERVPGF
jgi:hypothetical protein